MRGLGAWGFKVHEFRGFQVCIASFQSYIPKGSEATL